MENEEIRKRRLGAKRGRRKKKEEESEREREKKGVE